MTSQVLVRSLFACLLAVAAALPVTTAAPARVVAIGDIHGSLDGLVTILTSYRAHRRGTPLERRHHDARADRRLHGSR